MWDIYSRAIDSPKDVVEAFYFSFLHFVTVSHLIWEIQTLMYHMHTGDTWVTFIYMYMHILSVL